MSKPDVKGFFDPETYTISYVISDPATRKAAILDSVLDFDPKSGRTSTRSADKLLAFIHDQGLDVEWILETHAHADHLSAAPYLKGKLGKGRIAIGEHIRTVQETFRQVFNTGPEFIPDGRQFDHLFADGDRFRIGELEARVMHTPGHTPACVTYVVGDAVFVGDTLFMHDYGTARCDFPQGDAATLYRSIQKIFALPDDTRMFLCHDYQPGGREPVWETTVSEQKAKNIHIHEGVSEAEFTKMRTEKDKTLDMPVLILPSVQVNMRAGHLPPAEDNGVVYLKLPVNLL
ncbi:MAG: MBL fold metallo-hydrolase [Alphaproteobacteria bacterium]|nr:MAG: MBL fold metallo-hydrolase [Alphaproteobacteria bacterium]